MAMGPGITLTGIWIMGFKGSRYSDISIAGSTQQQMVGLQAPFWVRKWGGLVPGRLVVCAVMLLLLTETWGKRGVTAYNIQSTSFHLPSSSGPTSKPLKWPACDCSSVLPTALLETQMRLGCSCSWCMCCSILGIIKG